MGNPGSRSFPAVVIYNVDCVELAGSDAGQTVIFEREETPTDEQPIDEWTSPTNSNGHSPRSSSSPA